MKFKVTDYRTEEHIGRIPEPDYTRLHALLLDYFKADDIIFDHHEPMPCKVSVCVKTQGKPDIYHKIDIEERDLKQEAMDMILDSTPFNWDDVVHVTEDNEIMTSKGKCYQLKWKTV